MGFDSQGELHWFLLTPSFTLVFFNLKLQVVNINFAKVSFLATYVAKLTIVVMAMKRLIAHPQLWAN
jgi:hypothetical protein